MVITNQEQHQTLLIDIGNTNAKGVWFHKLAQQKFQPVQDLESAIDSAMCIYYCSVSTTHPLLKKLDMQQANQVITQPESKGVLCGYAEFQNLGVDRWVAVLGAHRKYQTNILVIDCGTATTIDYVTASGQHEGGWILPGITTMRESLLQNTDRIFDEVIQPEAEFGKNTPNALRNGCAMATVGAIHQAIQHIPDGSKIIFTGGDGALMQSLCQFESDLMMDLVFEGLSLFVQNDA